MGTRRGRACGLLLSLPLLWGGVAFAPSAQADSARDPWYMDTLRVEEVWAQTRGEGITVAVIDSGVDDSIPELEGQVLEGTDLTLVPEDAHTDQQGHGTNMAALIAGTGAGGGIRGLAPGVDILPIRVSAEYGQIDFGREERYAEAIEYAVDQGAQIVSISLAEQVEGAHRDEVNEALAEAARHDVLIFAGTGNDGEDGNWALFPAKLDGVIGVAAVDSSGARASYSTYGPQVAFAGPGNDVAGHCGWPQPELCLDPRGGTSSATALVSASAALIRSAHPDWTKNQVLRAMMETADGPGNGERNDEVGYGLVRPDRIILDGEGDPGNPDINPLYPAFEVTLDPPATPDPGEADTSAPDADPTTPGPDPEPTDEPAAAAESSGDSATTLAVTLFGLAGVVLVVGLVTALVLRRRSRTRA